MAVIVIAIWFTFVLCVICVAIPLAWRKYQLTGDARVPVLTFILCFALLWADAIPGYILFKVWGRTHPRNVIYETQRVEGFLYDSGDPESGWPYLGEVLRPYRFVEVLLARRIYAGRVGRYAQFFKAEGSDTRCVHWPRRVRAADGTMVDDHDAPCVAVTVSEQPMSRFAFQENSGPGHRVNQSLVFPIIARQRRVYEIATGRVIAESWLAQSGPILDRLLIGGMMFNQGTIQGRIFDVRDVLIPVR
jgi:hypothetical protein